MRAAGYYRPPVSDAPSEQSDLLAIERYCHEGLHTLALVIGPGDPRLQETDQYAALVAYLEGLGRGEALVVIPGPRHLSDTLDGLVERLIELDRVGGEVRCADPDLPDPLQNALETLPFAGRSPGQNRRVRESLLSKAARGEVLGRTPYGYVADIDGTFRIHPEEAAVVRRLFDLYAGEAPPETPGETGGPKEPGPKEHGPEGGPGLRRIAGTFNTAGLRTRSGRPWTPVTLSGMLRNRAYTGSYLRYGMRIAGNHDRIVSREVFNRVQAVMASRSPVRRRRAPTPYLLSGLARCWSCGRGLHGLERKRSWKRGDGSTAEQVYRYYTCPSRAAGLSGNAGGETEEEEAHPGWRAAELDRAVVEAIRSEPAERLRASFRPPGDRPLDNDQRTARQRFLEAVREVASGRGGVADLEIPLEDLRATQSMSPPGGGAFTFEDALRALDSLDTGESTDVHIAIASLVDRVIVHADRVEPVFRTVPA
ncbi:MAG: recombinase family protein [Chloroflexi bacterium]|nr:recombinase family protein [Chloroflexota bacterium]